MNQNENIVSAGLICAYLKKLGYETIDPSYYKIIQNWRDWYTNGTDEFHKSKFFNGMQVITVDTKQLGMAKTIAETWANLLMNEKVQISVGSNTINNVINKLLESNKFSLNGNQLCEMYCALGTGAFVEYFDNDFPRIDYIQADMIYPLSWDTRGIQECAFASIVHDKKYGDCLYIQIHLLNDSGIYQIENHMLQVQRESVKEVELPEKVEPFVNTQSDIAQFQIVQPNIINNVDIGNPMGISVFANAIDILKELDTSFNALQTEIETGRRRVFVAQEGFFTGQDGEMHNVISDNEDVLRWMGAPEDDQKGYVQDFSPTFRTNELKETIQFQLNLLSEKCGMGTNQFEFTSNGAKTATEIISEDSDMYTTLKKHELVLEDALKGMIQALGMLSGIDIKKEEINIDFDDSIIEDKTAQRKQDQADLANGTLRPEEYRAKWRNETLDEALKNLPESADVIGPME